MVVRNGPQIDSKKFVGLPHELSQTKTRTIQNGAILIVTPIEKPRAFYKITRDEWLEETINKIKQYTDSSY